jgi:hypothetical protein
MRRLGIERDHDAGRDTEERLSGEKRTPARCWAGARMGLEMPRGDLDSLA